MGENKEGGRISYEKVAERGVIPFSFLFLDVPHLKLYIAIFLNLCIIIIVLRTERGISK